MSAAMAKLQALADQAAADEAEVIAQLRPLADLGNAILAAYAAARRAARQGTRLDVALLPLVLGIGDRP